MTIAAVGLAPFAATHFLTASSEYSRLTWTTWVAIAQITLGAAVLANIALVWALSKGGLVRVAPLQFAQPVCALFFASTLLNEPLTWPLLLVAAAIVFGIVTASRGARPRSATAGPVGAAVERVQAVARFLSPMFLEQEQPNAPLGRGVESTRSAAEPPLDRFAQRLAKITGI